MTNFWSQDADDRWMATLLEADVWSLDDSEPRLQACADGERAEGERAEVLWMRTRAGRAERWLLLAGQQRNVFVNGVPLELGLHELRDGDEILIAGRVGAPADGPARRVYFSSERLARVEPLPAAARPVYCVRCKQAIAVGTPAVRCPSHTCGLWHHHSTELPCWEYAESCAACSQPTDLEVGFRWTPADL